jgi:hypothetical protein
MFRQTMIGHIMLRQNIVRRLALGSPYSKPSTAEDGLRNRQANDASPDNTLQLTVPV